MQEEGFRIQRVPAPLRFNMFDNVVSRTEYTL